MSESDSTLPDSPLAYEDISTHEQLIEWSRAYAAHASGTHDMAVDLERVDWRVSTRAKRRAAAVRQPRIPNAAVGTPIDWSTVAAERGQDRSSPKRCTMVLTWGAFEEFAQAEWAKTLRHELIHVEQFQRFGATNHRQRFKRRAERLDTTVHCRAFTTPKYLLTCRECNGTVARRYQECKLVRQSDRYRSQCCGAGLACERRASE